MHVSVERFATKKALKDAIASGKRDPFFHDSSMFNPVSMYSSDIPVGKVLYVVGPSEYERKWYAQVTKKQDGTVKVS